MNDATLTGFDRRLLDEAQRGVPLVARPYAALAERLGCEPSVVEERLAALRSGERPVVREIAGIFDATRVGYRSALVGCRVADEALDRAGAVVAGHPGVSHCYGRRGPLNLWFTLSIAPESRLGLDGTAARLGELIGAAPLHVLPATRRYKLRVHVGADGRMDAPADGADPAAPVGTYDPDATERRILRALQEDLPATGEPFAPLAAAAGVKVDILLRTAGRFAAMGVLRRYGAILHHRRAGVTANVMVAWREDPAFGDALGEAAAAVSAVSHCYRRGAADGWPYTLYTMIHGRTADDCRTVIASLAAQDAAGEHAALWTRRAYRKARVRLFSGDQAAWEQLHG
ncbi:MAG: Lrp/AsnC family transcriptional regulator [Planctomycetes bacterium]|nr:Lrp/AsnC family transcriptional regulator [Planctomycetota bacterium]